MSTRPSRSVPPRGSGCSSQRRKVVLNVDLNIPPSDHSHSNEAGSSTQPPVVPEMRARAQRMPAPPPVTIDVDSIEDDVVVLTSPRAFAEAKNNSRRTRSRSNGVDVELVESVNRDAANTRNKRHRVPPNQPIVDCESYAVSERNNNNVGENGRNMPPQIRVFVTPPPPPPPPPEPKFSCPICMGPFVEEVSTKCGHIFCRACIKTAIHVQSKCPTCRRKMTMKDTIKIYLPKTS